MPHAWLTHGRSTLDALAEWFTLFTPDPALWEQRATEPWPLRIETLPDEHTDLFGLGLHGALVVRPDGYIGAHWPDRPPSDSALHHALTTITCSTPWDAAGARAGGIIGAGPVAIRE